MRVAVTQDDIDRGEMGHCATCPVARALERATGKPWYVGQSWAWLALPPETQIALPPEVTAFILAFDHGEKVAPFSFDVSV